jgi:hypothetical protein
MSKSKHLHSRDMGLSLLELDLAGDEEFEPYTTKIVFKLFFG